MNRLSRSDRSPEARRRRHWFGIIRSLIILGALVVLAIVFTRQPAAPEVLSLTPARALDAGFRPVEPATTFAPGDSFFVSAEMSGYTAGTALSARWLYEGEVIAETTIESDDVSGEVARLSLAPDDPTGWPPGTYVVDVIYEDDLLGRTAFEVTAPGE